ncbi:hypothetical protein D1P53_003817 [Cryptococcus gattii VGV]|nr:hypothetical protein D1P53_003817 [Cryptococcus gattii VGV]
MGNIQDILHHAAQHGKIFAKLDCKDAFFQTLMKDEDIHKTAITTLLGLLEWVVMPQGIQNAPAAQQWHINEALQGLTGECCKAYVDDIIIWGKDAQDLYRNCSQFYLTETSFLGHIIHPGQILPDPTKIACIEQFPPPTTPKALHSFLGLLNYLHDFVPNLSMRHPVPTTSYTLRSLWESMHYRTFSEYLDATSAAALDSSLEMEGVGSDFTQDIDAFGSFDDFVSEGNGEEEDPSNEEL